MFKFFGVIFLSIIAVLIQVAFLPAFGMNIEGIINIPLLFFVFVSFFLIRRLSFSLSLILGLILDIYASTFFGLFTLIFLVCFVVLEFFKHSVLQNKSLLSFLILNWIVIFVWHLIYTLVLLTRLSLGDFVWGDAIASRYWLNIFYQFVITSFFVLFVYIFIPKFKRGLKGDLLH